MPSELDVNRRFLVIVDLAVEQLPDRARELVDAVGQTAREQTVHHAVQTAFGMAAPSLDVVSVSEVDSVEVRL